MPKRIEGEGKGIPPIEYSIPGDTVYLSGDPGDGHLSAKEEEEKKKEEEKKTSSEQYQF